MCAKLRTDHQLEKKSSKLFEIDLELIPALPYAVYNEGTRSTSSCPVFGFWERGITTQISNAKVKAKSKRPWF